MLKLDLSYKRLWFRLACPNGRMVVKPLRVNDQMAVFEAMVYAGKDDPEPLARFTSTVSAQEVPDGKFVQAAQDAALNEALENAGFGIQLCDLVEGTGTARYGSEIPLSAVTAARNAATAQQPQVSKQNVPAAEKKNEVEVSAPVREPVPMQRPVAEAVPMEADTPVSAPERVIQPTAPAPVTQEQPVEQQKPDMSAVNELLGKQTAAVVTAFPASPSVVQVSEAVSPSVVQTPSAPAEEAPAAPAEEIVSPSYTPDMSVEEICECMTLEEARNYVVNSGVCKGWTLAQVAERRAPSLRFYVFSDNGDNVLKAAATLVLNDMGMRKAG